MAQLPLNDPDVHPCIGEPACPSMPEPMHMDTACYAPEYRVSRGEFAHVTGVEWSALVRCEEEVLIIHGPGGFPIIQLPRCVCVNPDYPSLTSLSFEYSDGSAYSVYVAHPQSEHLAATQLCPQCQKKDAAVAEARNRRLESGEEAS